MIRTQVRIIQTPEQSHFWLFSWKYSRIRRTFFIGFHPTPVCILLTIIIRSPFPCSVISLCLLCTLSSVVSLVSYWFKTHPFIRNWFCVQILQCCIFIFLICSFLTYRLFCKMKIPFTTSSATMQRLINLRLLISCSTIRSSTLASSPCLECASVCPPALLNSNIYLRYAHFYVNAFVGNVSLIYSTSFHKCW